MANKSQGGAGTDADKDSGKAQEKPAARPAETPAGGEKAAAAAEPAKAAPLPSSHFATLSTGVPTAEEREAAARDRDERQKAAALGLGAHAIDEAGAEALAMPTNTARAQTINGEGQRPGGPESAVAPREVEAGFVRNGVDMTALGPTAKMLPLQHEAPPVDEYPKAVTNQPYGSEPGFVDSSTGERRFQPKRREHLMGVGQEPAEKGVAEKGVAEKPDNA